MSAGELAAALKATHQAYVSDSDETAGDSNDKLQVPNTIHSAIGTAMSHTPTDGMHAAHEEAISHTTSSETITPRRTKKDPHMQILSAHRRRPRLMVSSSLSPRLKVCCTAFFMGMIAFHCGRNMNITQHLKSSSKSTHRNRG